MENSDRKNSVVIRRGSFVNNGSYNVQAGGVNRTKDADDGRTGLAVKPEKTWLVLSHLSALIGYLTIIPFSGILGPLAIFLTMGSRSVDTRHHSLESLNFQITISIISLVYTAVGLAGYGIIFAAAVNLFNVISVCAASISAYQGRLFKYVLSLRLVK